MSALWDVLKAHGLVVLAVLAVATTLFLVVRWGIDSLGFFKRECQRDEAAEKGRATGGHQ